MQKSPFLEGIPVLARAALSRPLKWTLAGTLVLTAGALLWPAAPETTRSAVASHDATTTAAPRVEVDPLPAAAPATPSLATIADPAPTGGKAPLPVDPFSDAVPATAESLPPPPPAPPPPSPPAGWHFAGRLTGPDGGQQVYLSRGDDLVPVLAGTTLDNGWAVQPVTPPAVTLSHPLSGAREIVPIPPAAGG